MFLEDLHWIVIAQFFILFELINDNKDKQVEHYKVANENEENKVNGRKN